MTLDDATIASHLAQLLPAARWFADKAVTIERTTVHERFTLAADGPVDLMLADVRLAGSDASPRYVVLIDAAGDDATAAARWLVEMVLSGGSLAGRHGALVGHSIGGRAGRGRAVAVAPTDSLTHSMTVMPIGGDASNTSFVVRSGATAWIVKLIRRCRTGIQPEVELGGFFAVASPWSGTPRLCGWLEYVPADSPFAAASTALATVHEFAPGYTTGWDTLVGLLTDSQTPDDRLSGPHGDEVLEIVAAIGRATGQMHQALAARPDIPAFAPEAMTPVSGQVTAIGMVAHAKQVFSLIESRRPHLEPSLSRRLAAVLHARSTLVSRFDRLPSLVPATTMIRVHGDYHLGQLLVAEHDSQSRVAEQGSVLVIDFEGEPGRPLAERRGKIAAAKDVAGMCRSFDYLLRHVAKLTGRPYDTADLERLEACYLAAYREVATGQPWWPADRETADALLAVFKLDKAIYELAYELNNRPDWIDVPLAAIEEAVATVGK
jgi:maltose alpha-D-glucosyltransferase/alpha-amylase